MSQVGTTMGRKKSQSQFDWRFCCGVVPAVPLQNFCREVCVFRCIGTVYHDDKIKDFSVPPANGSSLRLSLNKGSNELLSTSLQAEMDDGYPSSGKLFLAN